MEKSRKSRINRDRTKVKTKDFPSDLTSKKLITILQQLDQEELKSLLEKVIDRKREDIPLSIFDNKIFSLNEAIVKYLHENLGMSFKEISLMTVKSNKTVWQLYRNSQNKSKKRIEIKKGLVGIPFEILRNKKLSTLELVVRFLKDEIGMSFNSIASRLNRDYKTVWTSYNRASKKHGKKK